MLLGGSDGSHYDLDWSGPPTIRLHLWDNSYSVIRSWNFEHDRAHGWYVNLESPWRPTSIGFDTEDLVLDITAADDLSSWEWKDIDELDWEVQEGKVPVEKAEWIRAEGRRVIGILEAHAWPFVDDWAVWRPNANWSGAKVPEGWDDVDL